MTHHHTKQHTDDHPHRHKTTDQHASSSSDKAGKSKSPKKILKSLIKRSLRLVKGESHKYPRHLPKETDDASHKKPVKLPYRVAGPHANALPDPLMVSEIGKMLVAKGIVKPSDLHEAMERKKQEPEKYLGQILSEMGFPQSRIMHQIYYSNKRKKLGEILLDLKMITPLQLQETLLEQQHLKSKGSHVYLATLMIKNRIINEEYYMSALSAHFSMPVIELKDYAANPEFQKAVGEKYALRNRILVLTDSDHNVSLAIAEPHLSVFDYLEKAMPRGKSITYYLARAMEIERSLQKTYDFDF